MPLLDSPPLRRKGDSHVVSPQDNRFGVIKIRPGQLAFYIDPVGQDIGHDMGSEAVGPIDRQMLRRSDGLAKHATGNGSSLWISPESRGNRFRAVFLDDVVQFRCNLTKRLVPRYLDPFPFTPFS